ncbi:MAG TPA: proprotein convertase P-domain-containing protein [Allocoleopsis sp.]
MQFASIESSDPWQFQPDSFPSGEGLLLQRSAEGLLLTKLNDRFTVRLLPERSLESVLEQLGIDFAASQVRSLGELNLVELHTDPDYLDPIMEQVRQSDAVAFASHVYQMQGNPDTPIYLTNQLTVQFAPAVTSEQMQSIASKFGLRVLKLVPGVVKAFAFEVTNHATANPIKLANRLLHLPEVLMAEPNIAVEVEWSIDPQEQPRAAWQSYSPQLGLESAWNLTRGSRSIAIAVMGKAIDWHHPILQGVGKIVAPLPDAVRANGEAGKTIPAYTLLPFELAPECACMPLLLPDLMDDQAVEQWFERAIEQGAAVVQGGWMARPAYFPLSLRQRAAITRAVTQGRNGKGCVVVLAAGDRNCPISGNADHKTLNGLALHPDSIPVTACTSTNQKAPLSNWGTGVAVCAVGQTTGEASAIVAGIAALMLSVNPDLTARTVKHLLQDTADRILAPQPEGQPNLDEMGYELGLYDGRGHSQWFGYGRVNATEAIRAAQQQAKSFTVPNRWIQQQNFIPVEIPDCDLTGVVSAIEIAERASIQDIQVTVELEHSFMGDLSLYLITPRGDELLLQSRTLGRLTQMNKTYTLENTPSLRLALHHSTVGQWQLKLVDSVRLHIGRLKRWELRLGV